MTASSVTTTARNNLPVLVAGRTVVLATADQAAGEAILRRLSELGAGRILVLGPPVLRSLAAEVDAELVEVDLEEDDPELTHQAWEILLGDPPPGLRSLLDARDPDRDALVLVSPWLTTVELLGRPVFGTHPPSGAPDEDRRLADHLWETAGIPLDGPVTG